MGLYAGTQNAGGIYPLAALPLRRQRACGTEELDLGASTPGLWTLGKPGVGGAHQRTVPGGVGTLAELLSALFETEAEVARRQPSAQALREAAHRLRTTLRAGHPAAEGAAAITRALCESEPVRFEGGVGRKIETHLA